ncbi:hypothetical protein FOZ61_008529 [Perkinsus olseni]|uniref:Uncharacterized protein n=1 Tax=Perkinsus olseni TaxID=32597 RepID=A0A7J6M6M5_PEROL|nr:hypothetical protein FOL46_003884 [Perkinsus olseni]KAF4667218.1 hypothetical protein FOZ61_008529 [Perkinsus olseni]
MHRTNIVSEEANQRLAMDARKLIVEKAIADMNRNMTPRPMWTSPREFARGRLDTEGLLPVLASKGDVDSVEKSDFIETKKHYKFEKNTVQLGSPWCPTARNPFAHFRITGHCRTTLYHQPYKALCIERDKKSET